MTDLGKSYFVYYCCWHYGQGFCRVEGLLLPPLEHLVAAPRRVPCNFDELHVTRHVATTSAFVLLAYLDLDVVQPRNSAEVRPNLFLRRPAFQVLPCQACQFVDRSNLFQASKAEIVPWGP